MRRPLRCERCIAFALLTPGPAPAHDSLRQSKAARPGSLQAHPQMHLGVPLGQAASHVAVSVSAPEEVQAPVRALPRVFSHHRRASTTKDNTQLQGVALRARCLIRVAKRTKVDLVPLNVRSCELRRATRDCSTRRHVCRGTHSEGLFAPERFACAYWCRM